jgi:hypothetical protein
MTPTHILVPIAEFTAENNREERMKIVLTSPKVDLSEEGIKKIAVLAKREAFDDPMMGIDYIDGYQQCAKDLLNTKP